MNIKETRDYFMAEKKVKKPVYFSTGITLLDLAVGGSESRGLPAGTIVNLTGDPQTGKSLICTESVAKNKSLYKDFAWNYDDAENGNSFNAKKLYGFDLFHDKTLTSGTVEEFDAHVSYFLKHNEGKKGQYVLDSLDGLSNNDKEERSAQRLKDFEAGKEVVSAGTFDTATPKFMSQDFFKVQASNFERTDSILWIISQTRQNMSTAPFKSKRVKTGGDAVLFFCSAIIWLHHVSFIVKNGLKVGLIVRAEIKKGRTDRPYRECTFSLYFDYGIDNIGSNLDYLFDLRTEKTGELNKRAEAIQWGGKEATLANVVKFLKDEGCYEEVQAEKLTASGKKALEIEWLQNYFQNAENKLYNKYKETFSQEAPKTREELIRAIEESPEMQKELENRVIAMWEAEEAKVATNRKPKYA